MSVTAHMREWYGTSSFNHHHYVLAMFLATACVAPVSTE